MKPKSVLILLILIVVLVGLWFYFAKSSIRTAVITVRSPDNMVTLEIPKDALPENVNAGEISVQPIEGKAFFGDSEAPGPAYELLPDGLVLASPAKLRIATADATPGVVPQAIHVSNGNVEWLDPSVVRINQEEKNIEAEFEISHFSQVGVDLRHGTFKYELNAGGTAQIGETIRYSIDISVEEHLHWFDSGVGYEPDIRFMMDTRGGERRDVARQRLTNRGFTYRVAPGTAYNVSSFKVTDSPNPIFSPAEVEAPAKDQKEYQSYRFETEFTCERVGKTRLRASSVDLRYRMWQRDSTTGKASYSTRTTIFSFYPDVAECTEKVMHEAECLLLGDEHYPVVQFRKGHHASGCESEHWHADVPVHSLEGTTIPDPASNACGFGAVATVPLVTCSMDDAMWEKFGNR